MSRYSGSMAVVTTFLGGLCGCVSMGSGQVLDLETNEPINGAAVELDCRRNKFHGSDSVRRVRYETNEGGKYKFSFSDVIGCSWVIVDAEKEGYIDSDQLWPHSNRFYPYSIPEVLYLTKESDAEKVRIRYLCSSVYLRLDRTWYDKNYVSFMEAKARAITNEDRKTVSKCFCGPLLTIYESLNDDDINWLRSRSRTQYIGGKYINAKIDHEREVIPYCSE